MRLPRSLIENLIGFPAVSCRRKRDSLRCEFLFPLESALAEYEKREGDTTPTLRVYVYVAAALRRCPINAADADRGLFTQRITNPSDTPASRNHSQQPHAIRACSRRRYLYSSQHPSQPLPSYSVS